MSKKKIKTLKDFEDAFISKDAQQLTNAPNKKELIKGKFYVGSKNALHQIDIVYFPETKSEYKYVLVVVDVATNAVDAEPMKFKDAPTTLEAYKVMLKRKKIKQPFLIMNDGGGEFKGVFRKFLSDHNIGQQITSRHRQLTPIDRICGILGKYLNKAMLTEELKTGKSNFSSWKKHLGKLISILNESYTKKPIDIETLDPDIKGKKDILEIDSKVRISLEKPIDYITSKRLHGGFRAGDIKFSKEIYTIYQILLNPSQPPYYILKDPKGTIVKDIAFNEFELQVIK